MGNENYQESKEDYKTLRAVEECVKELLKWPRLRLSMAVVYPHTHSDLLPASRPHLTKDITLIL